MALATLRLTDGTTVRSDEVLAGTSADLFQTDAYYALAAAVAAGVAVPAELRPVLENLLAMKSRPVREFAALIDYMTRNGGLVASGSVSLWALGALEERFPAVTWRAASETPVLIGRRAALDIVAKAVLHRLYGLFRRPYPSGGTVVRAWVEATFGMYTAEMETADVRVFPFAFNPRRQWRFLQQLKERRLRWSFDGLPYRLSDLLRVLFAGAATRPAAIARLEHRAFARYGRALAAAKVASVLTSEEFEVGSVAAGRELREAGIVCVNSAHGVGIYCPNVCYSELVYLTGWQAKFYAARDPLLRLRRRSRPNITMPASSVAWPTSDRPALVFVDQCYRAIGMRAEASIEDQVLRLLHDIGGRRGIPVILKTHPNFPAAGATILQALPGLVLAARWDDIAGVRPVFITINSTAFYDLRSLAPVLAYRSGTFLPEVYFDGAFVPFGPDELEHRALSLVDPAAWEAQVRLQQNEDGRCA